jgi:hypothetical protein
VTRPRPGAVRSFALLALLSVGVAGAQEIPAPAAVALLLTGPEITNGIAALGPNAVLGHRAEYQLGDARVTVSYTAATLPVPRDWTPFTCSGRPVFVSEASSPFDVLMPGPDQRFQVVFEFPASVTNEARAWCPFAVQFLDRFTYFQGFIRHESDIAFPAVIELQ